MRAVYFESFGGPVEVRELPTPEPSAGGVVIAVEATGLCRSDWHGWKGHDSDIAVPHVPGHELAGAVAAVGADVRDWAVGDRVTTPFVCGCGVCAWCAAGDAQVCPTQTQPGFTHWGSFAEYVAIEAADFNLVRVPDGVSAAAAASLGCRFATAYRGLRARANVQPEEWVLIVGAGGVGLSAVMIAKAAGARVVVVDPSLASRELALAVGADHAVPLDGALEAVIDLTGGCHVSMDAYGAPAAAQLGVLSLRRRGRHVQVGLVPSADGLTPVPLARALSWELDLLGSHGMAAVDYPALLGEVASGALDPARLIVETIGLDEAARRLPLVDQQPPSGVVMIAPPSGH